MNLYQTLGAILQQIVIYIESILDILLKLMIDYALQKKWLFTNGKNCQWFVHDPFFTDGTPANTWSSANSIL